MAAAGGVPAAASGGRGAGSPLRALSRRTHALPPLARALALLFSPFATHSFRSAAICAARISVPTRRRMWCGSTDMAGGAGVGGASAGEDGKWGR